MRIAFLYPRFTGPYGGERLILNLARNLSRLNNSVSIYTHSSKAIDINLTKGITIIEGNFPELQNHQLATFIDLIMMPMLIFKINKKFDLLVPMGWQSSFGGFIYKLIKKQKVIYCCMEPPRIVYDLKNDTLKKTNFIKKLMLIPLITLIKYIDIISVKSADEIISISDWTHDQVKLIYNRNSKIIYPGIEIDRFNGITKDTAKKILHIPKNKKIYLSVSKLHPRKRLDLAIQVFMDCKDSNSLFYIIGDGPYKLQIVNLIKKMRANNILLLGKLSDAKVVLYMKAGDYFIFTAQNEPFGIAPLEAYVAGCEVIPYGNKYKPKDWNTVAKAHMNFYKSVI